MTLNQRSANHLLQALPAAEFEALRPHLQPVELVRETVLVEAGNPLTHDYLPHSGAISMVVRLSEGQTVEAAMVGRDSVVGAAAALDGGISLTDAVVLLPGTASILDVADLKAAADRSVMFRNMLARHEQALLVQAHQSAACNASHSVEARLSRWLFAGARFVRQRNVAADPGIAGTNHRRATQRDFDCRPMRCSRPISSATTGGISKSRTRKV